MFGLKSKPVAALFLLLGAGTLAACQQGGPCRHHRYSGKHSEKHLDRMVSHLSRKLDLDESQKSQVRAMAASLRDEWSRHAHSRNEARLAAVSAFRSDSLDPALLESAWASHFEERDGMRTLALEKVKELHALLRPEQRIQLAQILEKRLGARN